METQPMQDNRPVNPRRKKKTKMEIFQEVYLPFLIVAASVLAIVGLVVNIASIKKTSADDPSNQAYLSQLTQQSKDLLTRAEAMASAYDYDGALELLATFEGDAKDFPKLKEAIDNYTVIKANMVSWSADQVPNLSFHVLIADLQAALADKSYGANGSNLYNRNFISTTEFSAILQQLYDNGYVLIDLADIYDYREEDASFIEKKIQLPAGKKPLLLTETHCNYYTYMEESRGFATKLLYNDTFYNEMVTPDGSTVTGSYDVVPLLEHFIQLHPDFSYKGARATLAFSGYDGVFGYRITAKDLTHEALAQEQADAAALAQALRDHGYRLACYTYDNIDYSVKNNYVVEKDIRLWQENIANVIGQTDVLVFAQEGDIGSSYQDNNKFDILHENGFHYFLGSSSILFQEVGERYVRHNRLLVTGSTLAHHADWFQGMIDTADLLDSLRGSIPE